ncbi:CCXG family PEP-CTERM protein [Roseomonas sp. AR75]|uniref:CCXG family PEP-CTERM protein n=1 Tax=Roseomonas sp. AR75 TaxID=2562311 RepID=UPI0010C021A0|nr:CCXG family PEP-CTERM protein [Roseomonas sp. AR75]
MRVPLAAAAAALSLLAAPSQASTITMQTREYTGGALGSAAAYQSLIDGLVAAPATAGYGDAAPMVFNGLNNSITMQGPSGSYAAKFTIDFAIGPGQAGTYSMQFGVDFGLGGALFVNGAAVAFSADDMWWGGSYNNAGEILQADVTLGAGQHRVTLYGLEGCCDGTMQGRFLAPNASSYTLFGTNDGLNSAWPITDVPAPAALGVFAVGLLGLVASRRLRAA